MFRKFIIAAGATAALAAAALSPTAASAAPGWHGGHHGHHGWHGGWYGPRFGVVAPIGYASDCYVVRRVVPTPYGPRVRHVTVCD